MEPRGSFWVHMAIICGSPWSGAVLSQVFLGSMYPRWTTSLVMAPAVIAWVLDHWLTKRRVRWQLALESAWLVVVVGTGLLALTGLVEFSEEGRTKRVLAVVGLIAVLFELRRLVRALPRA